MKLDIPQNILDIYEKINEKRFQIYFVGGSVRNILLEKPVKDWDMTTSATPEEILKLFPDGFYDNQFGTVGLPINVIASKAKQSRSEIATSPVAPRNDEENSQVVEVTTFRTEREYKDSRHPTEVAWGKSIEEDLERRDFTINAIAMQLQITSNKIQDTKLFDPFDGQKDLKNHVIRAVGDAAKRFKEDALRLMRAVRFATQLSFTIENETWKAMQQDSPLLENISKERVRDELFKILASDFPYEGIMMLKNANLLEHILPELLEGMGVSQERPGRHHVYDVFEHNVLSLKYCPSPDPLVRFATLIHDVGKPKVESKDENGLVIFYNHEVKGAQMAYEICERLHFSKKEREKVVKLIRWHMFSVDEHITDAAVRRFIRRIGIDAVKDLLDVRVGDRLGSGIPEEKAESWRLRKFRERIEEQLRPAPFSITDLAINGNDIMKELTIKPGPQIGKLLQQLFEEVDENLELNNREHLLKRVKELV